LSAPWADQEWNTWARSIAMTSAPRAGSGAGVTSVMATLPRVALPAQSPPAARSAQGRDHRVAVGGQGLLGLVVHQVHGELVDAEAGQLLQPRHVRLGRPGQAEPVHDLIRDEI